MQFRELAEHFQQIEEAPKRLEMTGLVVALFKATPKGLIDKVVNLAQGRLYPDFVGVELGVAEKLTIKAMARALGVPEDRIVERQRKLGDLGLAAEELMGGRKQRALYGEALTVKSLYETLEKIAGSSGPGSQEQKLRLLAELFHAASPLEARYLVRMVGGKLRLGIADQTILDALALVATKGQATSVTELSEDERAAREAAKAEVERALNVTSDLAQVCKTLLEDGLAGVRRMKMRMGVPIRPQLAERTGTLEEALSRVGGTAIVEYKYDGLRVQAHLGKETRLFSRRLEEVTSQFPDLVAALNAGFRKRGIIVEGETVAVDPKTGRIRPFQDVSQRRGRKYGLGDGGDSTLTGKRSDAVDMTKEIPVRLYLFDILVAEGEVTTDWPLQKRRERLEQLLRENEGVRLAESRTLQDVAGLEDYFDKVTAMGAEGIMIKSPQSVYKAGNRGYQWIKFKADYKEGVVDSFDLVPIGAYWGQGRRGGWYGALLLASVNEKTGRFESVCRLATGFDDPTLASLEKRFAGAVSDKKPRDVDSEEEPDVWLQPRAVIEVLGAELTLSPRHRCAWGVIKPDAGLSVRFPRFTGRWRTDKKPSQATTGAELVKVYQMRSRTLHAAKRPT